MPRKPRFFVPGLPAHVIQRGNNRQAIFFEEEDYLTYMSMLAEGAGRYGCAIHSYVLMTNHVHLLLTPDDGVATSKMMQYTGRHYVPYINNKYQRSGTLWEGRFRASIIDSDAYLLACYRYIELNPVRAGMVALPGEYRWSGYAANACCQQDSLITPHECYLLLGKTEQQRASFYRAIFDEPSDPLELAGIRRCTQSGTPLGNKRFRQEVEATLSVKVGQETRGRPVSGPKGL